MSGNDKTPEAVGVLAGCVAAIGWPFATAWAVMIALGALHTAVPGVPALGYWPVFACLAALNVAAEIVRRAVRK